MKKFNAKFKNVLDVDVIFVAIQCLAFRQMAIQNRHFHHWIQVLKTVIRNIIEVHLKWINIRLRLNGESTTQTKA